MTRRIFLAGLPLAAKRWDREEWTGEFASKLLTDSPWAKPIASRFRFRLPAPNRFAQIGERGSLGLPDWGGGPRPSARPASEEMPAETEANLTVRWASALPLRRARAVLEYGSWTDPRAAEVLRKPAGEYVLEIAGFPTTLMTQGTRRMEAELLNTAEIALRGQRPMRALSASVPDHGMHLMATLRFPAYSEVPPADGFVTVTAQTGAIAVSTKFALREMLYSGSLEM
ncbi:MAG: hypothetical protein FJW30_26635 [Acidobacteria bacterium]|nr:hypothetical protein [Acidobacteriota bacterium]